MRYQSCLPTTFLPPSQHPRDQAKNLMPPVNFQIWRLFSDICESRDRLAFFLAKRLSDPQIAEAELTYAKGDLDDAFGHITRLEDLLTAGYQIVPRPRPKFSRGQQVRVISQDGDKPEQTAVIRDVLWSEEDQHYCYYAKHNAEASKCYIETDLEACD
jgi:hypothetical protein